MTRSQMGQLWLKLPCRVMFFCTSGSMLKPRGCGPQPTLLEIHPAGRTMSSAILSVMLAPAASMTPSQPRPSRFQRPRFGVADDDFAAVLLARFQDDARPAARPTMATCAPHKPCHRRAEDADGAGSEHDDAITGLDACVLDDRAISDAAGLGEAGLLEGKLVRHMMQACATGTRTYLVIAPFTP